MDNTALRHAWERLHKAQAALDAILKSTSVHQISSAWSDFLSASSAVYSKLEKGSKGHSKSEPWFGRVKNERRTDPLLSYVHHARNTDEHGISDVVHKAPGHFAIKGDVHIDHLYFNHEGKITSGKVFGINPNRPLEISSAPATITLLPVTDDRYGDTFEPPKNHLGVPLKTDSLAEVAQLAYKYLERIVREASSLSKEA